MEYQEYLNKRIEIQNKFLEFLENEEDVEEKYQAFVDIVSETKITDDYHEMKSLLGLISKLTKNHSRGPKFCDKILQIMKNFKNNIKEKFSNYEIFKIFKRNKILLLFCFQEQILNIDHTIYHYFLKKGYIQFFQPEILAFMTQPNNKTIYKKEIKNFPKNEDNDFLNKRNIGENDSYISKLIREDSIEEFITFVNKNDYSLKSTIEPSIYETNTLLTKSKISLIEYAAFYGSVQIFKYLYKNGVFFTQSLWIHAIHGYNEELIRILEESKMPPFDNTYEECIKEAIKCHHNDMVNYIMGNLANEKIQSQNVQNNFRNNRYVYSFQYYNYSFFPEDPNYKFLFYYACQYNYFNLVELYYKTKKIDLYEEIVFDKKFF